MKINERIIFDKELQDGYIYFAVIDLIDDISEAAGGLNREEAIILIEHLKKVFELDE